MCTFVAKLYTYFIMKISKIYVDFDARLTVILLQILAPANIIRYQLLTALVTKINNLKTEWDTIFAAYSSPLGHLPGTTAQMEDIYGRLFPLIEQILKFIEFNPHIELSADEKTNLFITDKAEKRGHIPRPTIISTNELEFQNRVVVRILTYHVTPPDELQKKLPVDVAKIDRKIAIMKDLTATPKPEDYVTVESTTSATWEYVFDESALNQRIWIRTCYANPTGEQGPWSDPLDFVLY